MASVNGQRFVPACHQGFAIGSSMIHLTPPDLTQIDWWVGFCMCVLSNVGSWGVYIDECHPRSNQKSGLFMWNSEKAGEMNLSVNQAKRGKLKKSKKGGDDGKNL